MSQAGVLSSNGGPSPSPALVLIQTKTASSLASLPFTTGITSIYNNYLLFCTNFTINPAFSGINFLLQISTDGGVTYINSGYFDGNSALTGLVIISVSDIAGSFGQKVPLLNFTSGNGYLGAGDSFMADPSMPSHLGLVYGTASTIVNAFQLVADDGSTFSGTFSLYGYTF